ncbi:alpha-L-rhamnosidase N-terminal domain-containing protein [Paenibacillus sp. GCM10023252]|uniref:alpha-L-rhamnosidase-related protein n=1 Tax=Paenibacillus sp. GCM10023252 TaxID=3252649 RepID=UPI0036228D0D
MAIHNASWIWHEELLTEPNVYVEFRRLLVLPAGVSSAVIQVSACQEYVLYVNGTQVGRGPSPCSPEWQYFDEYVVTSLLREGDNVIAALCYHFGEKDIVIEQMQGPAGFILELEVDGAAAGRTDSQWSVRRSPRYETRNHRISRWSGFNEIYVADREDEWLSPGYTEAEEWKAALVVAKPNEKDCPWTNLIPREIPQLYYHSVSPVDIVRVESNYGSVAGAEMQLNQAAESSANNSSPSNRVELQDELFVTIDATVPYSLPGIVYDFGHEVVGRPELVVDAPEGGVLRLAYGESLELQYVDTFVLKKGVQRLSPYGRRACRYMQLTFMATPEPVKLLSFTFLNQHYAFSEMGSWVSNVESLNRIWSISRYTTLMNSHDHLEDCPWREKALWVADAVVMGKVIYHLFGDTLLLRKCLLQGARIQHEEGWIPGTGPERNQMLLPDFNAHWLLGVRDYVRYSGDYGIIRELWPVLEKLMNWFAAQRDETGMIANAARPGWSCFIDWTAHMDKRDKVSAISMLYYAALEAMIELAEAAGEPAASARYRAQAGELAHSIREHVWLEEQGAFSDCMVGMEVSTHLSLQTNFLGAWCGLMSESESRSFIETYYDTGKLVEIKGAFFQHIVLEVLIKLNMKERAYSLIRSFWGAMAERGATTWWETFNPSSPACSVASTYQGNVPTYLWEGPLLSQCHAWGASPAYILHHIVTGVNVLKLGDRIIHLSRPLDGGPTKLEAELPTRYGPITVSWERDEATGLFSGSCAIPSVLTVEVDRDYPSGIEIISY